MDIQFNSAKSNIIIFWCKKLKDIHVPSFPLNDDTLPIVNQCKYLGHVITDGDIVLSSQKEFVDNVVIQEPLGSSDHNQLHFTINIKSDKTKVKQCRRDFRRGNYEEIRKSLAFIDGNDKMNNKTATECWKY